MKIADDKLEVTIWNDEGKIVVQEKVKAFTASQSEIDQMVGLIQQGTPAFLAAQLVLEDKSPYIHVSLLGSGYAAVMMEWQPEGFWDVFQTGIGRYKTREEAVIEAKIWSETDEVRYVG